MKSTFIPFLNNALIHYIYEKGLPCRLP
jgi:hypothetical protein